MTNKKTEALKLALEALEDVDGIDTETECVTIDVGEAITAIREALAEQPAQQQCMEHGECFGGECIYPAQQPAQQQEPVAYVYEREIDGFGLRKDVKFLKPVEVGSDLYTSPPASKPLTDEEIDKLPWGSHEGNPMTFAEGLRDFARAIETKLKEKNT